MTAITLALTSEERQRLCVESGVSALAAQAYDASRRECWPFLTDVLARILRGVNETDAGIVASAAQALVKYDRLLAFASGVDGTADSRLKLLLSLAQGDRPDIGNRIAAIDDETERLGTEFSMPNWLIDLVRSEVGPTQLVAALTRMNACAPRVVRANTLKTGQDDLVASLTKEGLDASATTVSRAGVLIQGRRSPFRTRAFTEGAFEMQDEASQMVAELVAPPPHTRVVDACAGAGGKTLAIAALLDGQGQVIALDPSSGKLAELKRRARRAGASNVRAVQCDLLLPDDERLRGLESSATRVLVDAPCTGLGAIRRNPEARWRLGADELGRLTAQQSALLFAASRLVIPHGRVVYATCSFLPSEGARIVEGFLANQQQYSLVTAREIFGRARAQSMISGDGKYLSTWRFDGTDESDADGFFAAVLRKVRPRAA